MNTRNIFVTGIGTDVGKTIISAVLTEALNADYWKPIQSGYTEGCDSERVKKLISNPLSKFHKERYLLKEPLSPHVAAILENIEISLKEFSLPKTENRNLVIEGAGGILVPINNDHVIADLIEKFDAEVIVVSRNYLGSINHTLLTLNELERRKLKLKGIIFNGNSNLATESIILKKYQFDFVGRVNYYEEFTKETTLKYAAEFKGKL
jgi:dethiobiotin synthetase